MRVLLLTAEAASQSGRTTTAAAEVFARGLAGRAARVDLVVVGAKEERITQVHWDGVAPEEGSLTVHGVQGYRASLSLTGRLLRAQRYDVLHLLCSLPTGAILPFLRLKDTPVVVSLQSHDLPGREAGPVGSRLLRPLTRWIWRRADRVVVDTENVGRQAQDVVPGLRYSLIHQGLDVVRFRPRLSQHPRRDGRIRCLAVSRSIGSEGLADLIRAMSTLAPDRFELEMLNSSSSFDRDLLARRYREADLFVVTSWEEPYESGFAEALASGLPIVGPEVGPTPSLIHHGRSGLLVPLRNPSALAGAIQRLADDASLRAKIGKRNRAEAEANLAWDRVTSRFLSIYQGVQRRAPRRPLLAEAPSGTW